MRYQVRLHEPRCWIIPAIERPNRHAAPHADGRRGTSTRSSGRLLLNFTQRPVDRRSAHCQQTGPQPRCQFEMNGPPHSLDKDRYQRPQPLDAYPIRRLPEHDQRLAYRVVIHPPPETTAGSLTARPAAKQTHRMLAMQARQRPKLVQNAPPILSSGPGIPLRHHRYQLVPCRHADPPHARPRRTPAGSKLREATDRRWGAFQVRQCAPADLLSLALSGLPFDVLFRLGVQSVNGLSNAVALTRQTGAAGSLQFFQLLQDLRRLQIAGLLRVKVENNAARAVIRSNSGPSRVYFLVATTRDPDLLAVVDEAKRLLGMSPAVSEAEVVYGLDPQPGQV